MSVWQVLKFTRKTFVNPSGWIDYDYLKYQNNVIKGICRPLFSSPDLVQDESFENAMERLNLTEEDVQRGARTYRFYALLFVLFGFLVFFYAFYLLFRYFTIAGWALGLAASALFFSQAFKYDFWAYQMRVRRLGVTFNDWKRSILGDKGSST